MSLTSTKAEFSDDQKNTRFRTGNRRRLRHLAGVQLTRAVRWYRWVKKRKSLISGVLTGRLAVRRIASQLDFDWEVLSTVRAWTCTAPLSKRWDDPEFVNAELKSPPLNVYATRNVLFEPHQDYLEQGGKLTLQQVDSDLDKLNQNHALGSSYIVHSRGNFCLVNRNPDPAVVPCGIVLQGKFPKNWYHWMVNILPKLELLSGSALVEDEVPILVSESIKGSNFEEALRLAASSSREVIFLKDSLYLVENAYLVDSPCHEIKAIKGGRYPSWSNLGYFHYEVMSGWRSRLLELVDLSDSSEKQKLFLLRGTGNRRAYNEAEVREFVESRGYLAVEMANLSVLDQVKTFANAEVIVGTTGAQWTGVMWATQAKCLYLVPRFLTKTSTFPKLGSLGGSHFYEFPLATEATSWPEYYGTDGVSEVALRDLGIALDWIEGL